MNNMKKVWNMLRSMRFGMLLLCLILLCSLPGSLIQQGNGEAFYLENYSWGALLLALQFDRIFSSWYFVALLALLCLNLTLCSVLRIKSTSALHRGSKKRMEKLPLHETAPETAKALETLFKGRGLRCAGEADGKRLYRKNALGFYGSFITHLGLLLTLLFAAGGLYFAQVEDYNLTAGESFALADGTVIALHEFREQDDAGKVDYVSTIVVTDRHGAESEPREIRVNEPFNFGGHKYYQQNYGAVGAVGILHDGVMEKVKVDGQMFLTLDGETGVAIYGMYAMDEHADNAGETHGGTAYAIGLYEGAEPGMGMAFAGDSFTIGGVTYTFLEPVPFSGIRVKTVSPLILGGLYASFVLLTLGLYLCFFASPVYAVVGDAGYALWCAKKDVLLQREIDRILSKGREA